MKYKSFTPIVLLLAFAFCLGQFSPKAEASQRYGYRSHYGTYRYRPAYRAHRYSYRPYYRPYSRPYFSVGFGFGPYFGAYSRPYYYGGPYYRSAPAYYAGGQVGYSYQTGSVRTKVTPKATEVYVDGYFAGVVDDFDGAFQRLYVPPGQHEIELRLEGHRSHRQSLMVNSGTTYKLHHEMQPLGRGETNPSPSPPEPREPDDTVESYQEPPPRREPPPQERIYRSEEQSPAPPAPPRKEQAPRAPLGTSAPASFGMLSLRVKPADAEILVDGETWGTLEVVEEMIIHLPAGRHRVEIRKEGYRSFSTDVDILQGEVTPLHVGLAL